MKQYAVLTAVGADRPGLVDSISKFILENGCNINDSRMAVLGGEFAMLILIDGETDAIDKVVGGTATASERSGLAVQCHRTRAPGESAKSGTIPYKLDAYSMDHPGIVQSLARYLAERKINIRALDTRLTHAPVTGLPLFSLHAIIDVPSQENVMELRQSLESIGAQQNIDVVIKPDVAS
jgi:glycine cleavage system transcriptional repressor